MTHGRRNSARLLTLHHIGHFSRGERSGRATGSARPQARAFAFSLALLASTLPALATPIANPVATFSGLDKITTRLTKFDAYVNETVQFGSLQITPRACYTRPPNETQRTSVFVEVDQVSLAGSSKRIFTGWMFADSPALNAIDDAVYDFWLVDCKQRSDVPPPKQTNPLPAEADPGTADAAPAADPLAAPAPATAAPPPNRTEAGSFITLLNPAPAAETSPDAQ